MELLALYIAILALLVAIPGTVDATWNVILKIRALKKGDGLGPTLLKKSEVPDARQIPSSSKKESSPRPAFASSGLGIARVAKPDLVSYGGFLHGTLAHEVGHGLFKKLVLL